MTVVTAANRSLADWLVWIAISIVGAVSLAVMALYRGETINALWLVTAAVAVYLIAFRFYARYVETRVLGVDETRSTPAHRHNDGLDYVPTDKWVLFGHHFAAIAGAGPLVGPVLAAQMGYLPGTMWLLAGVVFAGAVQDFVVLFASTRRDGRSLGDMIKTEMGATAGIFASIGILMIMIILLAVLALIVVKALAGSPWGTFTVFATIPIALVMGVYGRFIRPGRIAEMSVIGIVLLIALATWILSFIFTPLTSGFISEGNRRIPPVVVLVVIGYVITQIYFTVSWASSGRTVGNLIMGVRVVDYRGNRLAWWVAFLRAAFVIAFPVGLFWVLVSGANRSVQDVVLRTSVIYDWVVGTPTLAAVIGRNREARRSS